MVFRRRIGSSFIPAAWWHDHLVSEWRARPLLRNEIIRRTRCRKNRAEWPRPQRAGGSAKGMRIIAVTEVPFSGGQDFAKALASSLGLRYVDAAILVERAAASGGDRKKLCAALKDDPTFRDRFTRHRLNQVLQLQAALAEEIRDGNVVCFGIAAEFLCLPSTPIFRIEIRASHGFRRLQVQELLNLYGAEARCYLNECDRSQRRWSTYLIGWKPALPVGSDLVVNPENETPDDAYRTVSEMARDQGRFGIVDLAPLQHFFISTRIKAALARNQDTAHLDVDVEIEGDTATLRGMVRSPDEIDAIKQVRMRIPQNMRLDVGQMPLGSWDYAPPFFAGRAAKPALNRGSVTWSLYPLRPAWLMAGVSAAILLVGSWVVSRWSHQTGTSLLSFTGVITDSQCGLSHKGVQPTAECVRTCVKVAGAKYVLADGTHLLVLVDQKLGERFAGQKVIATGFVDKNTEALQVRTMRAAED